jgi:hypothetical protein
MITVEIDKQYSDFIYKYADKLTLNGFSNLSSSDLKKASRNEYQYTGLYGEVAWNVYRFGSIELMQNRLDIKIDNYYKTGQGDGGFDDCIEHKGKKRNLDIKTSHCNDSERIKYLNLIIPQREWHEQMIYIAAFSVGKDRKNVDKVILAGWCITEDIHKKWSFDNTKWCVPVTELRDMKDLDKYIR